MSDLQALQAYQCGPRAVEKYVETLSTESVAALAEETRRKLRTRLSTAQRERWEAVWEALLAELERRQMTLWEVIRKHD
jgi:hypothetical protein